MVLCLLGVCDCCIHACAARTFPLRYSALHSKDACLYGHTGLCYGDRIAHILRNNPACLYLPVYTCIKYMYSVFECNIYNMRSEDSETSYIDAE